MVENMGKKLQNITHIPSFLYLSLIESRNSPRAVCIKKREDRRAGEITTERMPANQESVKRILFGGVDGGVIDPAVRPIRSVIPKRGGHAPSPQRDPEARSLS